MVEAPIPADASDTGYAYQQITADSGQLPILGSFESRVLGVGPQIGYLFPVGGMQG
ncbi:transporter [Bradyrhizobium elkanii]|nr:transporter [Bradyrhizobium elkanii]